MLALIHPVLSDRRTGIWRKPFEPSRVRCGRGDDRRVVHRAALFQRVVDGGDRGALLPDSYVDTPHLLFLITGFPVLSLVENGVHADGGLAGLTVADDQLPLATADRRHRVDGLNAGLQRLFDALTLHHRRSLNLQRPALVGFDVTAAIDRVAERVDDAAKEPIADWYRKHLAGALHLLALFNFLEVAQDHRADAVLVEVERHAQNPAGEFEQLLGHHRWQALNVRNTVAGVDDGADLLPGGVGGKRAYVLVDRALNVVSGDCQLCHGFSFFLLVDGLRGVSVWQLGLGRGETRRKRTVDDLIADRNCEPAQQLGVDLHLH